MGPHAYGKSPKTIDTYLCMVELNEVETLIIQLASLMLRDYFKGVCIDPTAPFKMYQVRFRAFNSPPI